MKSWKILKILRGLLRGENVIILTYFSLGLLLNIPLSNIEGWNPLEDLALSLTHLTLRYSLHRLTFFKGKRKDLS